MANTIFKVRSAELFRLKGYELPQSIANPPDISRYEFHLYMTMSNGAMQYVQKVIIMIVNKAIYKTHLSVQIWKIC